jgi:hypothetical protein
MATTSERAQDQTDYHAYLLRLWRESGVGEAERDPAESPALEGGVWRASLESPQAGEPQGFASLEDLFAFLRQQTSLVSETDQDSAA